VSGTVAITGSNSATGCAIVRLAALSGAPALVACVRSERAQTELPPLAPQSRAARIAFSDPDSLERAFAGARSVVHLPGVLIERAGSSYEEVNVASTLATVEAARRTGVGKLVLVSALGADPQSRNRYYASKGRAERIVQDSGVPFTVLRAPLILGTGTEGSAALRHQTARGATRLLGGGRQRVQPLDVGDLARAVLRAAEPDAASGACLELAGPELLTYHELVQRAARIAGLSVKIGSVPIPIGVLRLGLALRSRLVGPGFSVDALDVILDEKIVDPELAWRVLGLTPTPLEVTLELSLRGARRVGRSAPSPS
jgi:NADH dehydrogenase